MQFDDLYVPKKDLILCSIIKKIYADAHVIRVFLAELQSLSLLSRRPLRYFCLILNAFLSVIFSASQIAIGSIDSV